MLQIAVTTNDPRLATQYSRKQAETTVSAEQGDGRLYQILEVAPGRVSIAVFDESDHLLGYL